MPAPHLTTEDATRSAANHRYHARGRSWVYVLQGRRVGISLFVIAAQKGIEENCVLTCTTVDIFNRLRVTSLRPHYVRSIWSMGLTNYLNDD
jgi:hypothetical protein